MSEAGVAKPTNNNGCNLHKEYAVNCGVCNGEFTNDGAAIITILEDWNERDGKIYFRWKLLSEDEWHEKLTPYKTKPIVNFKYMPVPEYEHMVKKELGKL